MKPLTIQSRKTRLIKVSGNLPVVVVANYIWMIVLIKGY